MKRIITLIAVAIYCMSSFYIMAQAVEEVTLTVSSDGPTKEEATKNALRGAIEQAYGAFVSANTAILNDELVKDEIVTVSNGSIKAYKELSCTTTQNGGQYVTLQATVSLPQLIKYSRSKGSECEFAGNTFAMEMKLWELNKESELKALQNLKTVLSEMHDVCDYDMVLDEPTAKDNKIAIRGSIVPLANTNTQLFFQQLLSTLEALHAFEDWAVGNSVGYRNIYETECIHGFKILFRNPESETILKEILTHYLNSIINGFQICDNISSPTSASVEIYTKYKVDYRELPCLPCELLHSISYSGVKKLIEDRKHKAKKEGDAICLFPGYFYSDSSTHPRLEFFVDVYRTNFNLENDKSTKKGPIYRTRAAEPIDFIMTIPSTEISKYNNFKIEKKPIETE